MKIARVATAAVAAFLFVGALFGQQSRDPVEIAPVPSPILTAKKVFVANGGEVRNFSGNMDLHGDPNQAYDKFYAAMKTWGKYALVSAPSDSDLVLQISVDLFTVGDLSYHVLTLEIVDSPTRIRIWKLSERVKFAGGRNASENENKYLDESIKKVLNDLKALSQPPAENNAPTAK